MADKPRDERMIAALLRERDGLVALGKADRVQQVDEQLKLHGYDTGESEAEESEKDGRQARKQPPQGRSTRPQATTD